MTLKNADWKHYERLTTYPEIYTTVMLPSLERSMVDNLVDYYIEKMPDQNKDGPNCYIQGMVMGGAISTKAINETAFPWRTGLVYAADSMCSFKNSQQQIESQSFVAGYYTTMVGWSRGIYLNFPQVNENYAKLYWSTNLPRLMQVRTKWNPNQNNPLSFPQEVPLANVTR